MRLDARNGDKDWQCYDCERAALVPQVVWVDEESATWGEFDASPSGIAMSIASGFLQTRTHHEKTVKVVIGSRMVLFNQLDDIGEIETVRDVIASLSPPIPEHTS